jgi:meiotically up-regulated gene 157 (Mug157) protein
VDSLCWALRLLRGYAQATGDLLIYAEPDVRAALAAILTTFETEREHTTRSHYSFRRPLPGLLYHDTTSSHPVAPTGMIWSAFRPSDDGCSFNYLIPSQMFVVVELRELARAFDAIYRAPHWVERVQSLVQTLQEGIDRYGIVQHPTAGRIYAYEVDGLGHYNLMDDANLPSLLGIPELGYCPADDPVYLNTRRFVLSQANPYFYEGRHAAGVGSPHTPAPNVWPLSLIVQALTSTDRDEVARLLSTIRDTDGGTGYIHESFDPNDPRRFTREWFAWGNALFAELVLRAYYDARQK